MIRSRRWRRGWLAGAAGVALLGGMGTPAPAAAAPEAQPQAIDIGAGPLDQALLNLASQAHVQLIFSSELVAGRRTRGLVGSYSVEAAIAQLLGDAPVSITRTSDDVVVLKPRPTGGREGAAPPSGPFGGDTVPAAAPVTLAAGAAEAPAPPVVVEELRVTGSNIRGAPAASPILTVTSEDLQRSGYATVAEALQALPQAFAGEASEATVLTRADRTATNASYASGINLRGLGSDATLVLVNGRRLSGSGNRGDFADLSAIPTIAVSRVEVLLDGASAIYGSDAVAGVVNVILRRDVNGGEVRLRAGEATAGDPREVQAGALVGRAWRGGGALLALEAYRRTHLSADDRDFSASADLRAGGGADRRDPFAFPGNIVRINPATGLPEPFWAIPPGQPGVGLQPGDLRAATANLSSDQAGQDLLPKQSRYTVYASAHQDLARGLEVLGDARYSQRRTSAIAFAQTSTLSVNRNNPFFISPVGASSEQIDYSFQGELPNPRVEAVAKSFAGTLGMRLDLPASWSAEGYGAYAEERINNLTLGQINGLFLNEALGVTGDNPATPFRTSVDGFFNPFTGVAANNPAVRAFISSGFSDSRYRTRVTSFGLQADGPVLSLPAGSLKLALGVQARRETYARGGLNFIATAMPVAQVPLSAARQVEAAFLEAHAPLVGPETSRPGLRSLDLDLAVRAERYSDFGDTVNPKAGLSWSPRSGVKVRATYGSSFRAPALQELGEGEVFLPLRLPQTGTNVLTLALSGGNPSLRPETARSWTVGFDLAPPEIPGLQASATWFRTNFKARIDRPLFSNRLTALTDPTLASFVRRLDPSNPADEALIAGLLADPHTLTSLAVFPASDYRAITDFRYVNTGRLEVSGLDAQASYHRPAWGGEASLTGNASWLFEYRQQATPLSPLVDSAGIAGFPAKFRGRLVASWAKDPVSADLAVNRLGGFHDNLGARIGGQTTVDAQLRLTGPAASVWTRSTLSLQVRNLFDSKPPFYDNPIGLGFDPASADPIGRFVALQLTHAW